MVGGQDGEGRSLGWPWPGPRCALSAGGQVEAGTGSPGPSSDPQKCSWKDFQRSAALLNPSGAGGRNGCLYWPEREVWFSPCGGIALISKHDTGHNGHW